ncbi:hypothetical protein FPQ18DRAFT_356892 [Pyronema domesticum]|uniref:Similar to MKL/myocardin-like protein 1 acc. no. Q969V6 n=1 Tax=Pyronema omphalodes (strain CBS 100304) TaxID=1076935 RepID=U4L075_PYROM|nr:hypothetical protein FPQ18DRAFT_356892 [Pyronema domesticum]CCX07934.1 Similar to MKL/myocardin-like protein 1; acc. no. Q969V6 [Pyronema omphalodes CBS 100304]
MADTAIDTAAEPIEQPIDETPLSPISARKNSLQHALARRPDEKDLKDRNILHHGAPSIQKTQAELEKQMAQDALKRNLANRPTKEELLQKHILPENSNVAPALQAAQRELEKQMREDALREKLAHRPKPEEVIEKGILAPEEDPTKV